MDEQDSLSAETHNSNLTLAAILSQKTTARPSLPAELIAQILTDESRHILIASSQSSEPCTISHRGSVRYGVQQSPWLLAATDPLSQRQVTAARRVVFKFTSKDQGWSSYHSDHGSYRNSWTWFEVGKSPRSSNEGKETTEAGIVEDEIAHRHEIQRNLHAGSAPETYTVNIDLDADSFFGHTKEGDRFELWGCAQFPGWVNNVTAATVEIWGVDDLSEGWTIIHRQQNVDSPQNDTVPERQPQAGWVQPLRSVARFFGI